MGKLTLREVKRFAPGHMTSKCRKSRTQVSQHLVLVTFSLWLHWGTVLHLCEMNLWLAVRIWREQHPWLEWVEISAASNTYWFPLLCCHGKTQLSMTPTLKSLVLFLCYLRWVKALPLKGRREVCGYEREDENQHRSPALEKAFLDGSCLQNMLSSPISFFIVICCDN